MVNLLKGAVKGMVAGAGHGEVRRRLGEGKGNGATKLYRPATPADTVPLQGPATKAAGYKSLSNLAFEWAALDSNQ
jgi:hypothetical protein